METIREVRCFTVTGAVPPQHPEERQVGMLDIYPEFAARGVAQRHNDGRRTEAYVEVETEGGVVGLFGPIFAEVALLIVTKLAPVLRGRDPLAGELLWDLMYRQDRHARTGYQMMAISAVDNALWDVRGKVLGQPVYRLLGGPTRERVAAYSSMLGFSLDPDRVRAEAQARIAEGYRAQKWFFRYGPADGLEGMERNLALVRTVREAVGPHIELMFDCWMGWDTTYAIRMLERMAEYHPRWLEEPVPPDRVGDLAAIRRASRIPIATGEHEYTRWGFLKLLQADAVDVIQADPDWCGGISELVKICALASGYGRQVIPHGHSVLPALHVIASQPPATCPMAEFLLTYQPPHQAFHTPLVVPEGGSFALPTTPGLGIALDTEKIVARRTIKA